jgi:phage tail protein X
MARYSPITVITTPEDPKRRYLRVKYPIITRDFSDIYVYTTQGDRYDLLALSYYNNSSLWWVIARANADVTTLDSLYPNEGIQIRIPGPSRISSILSNYETLNS